MKKKENSNRPISNSPSFHSFPQLFIPTPTGVQFRIKVTPKASSNRLGEVIKTEEGYFVLKVYVTSVPEQGKANEAVIAILAKSLHLPKRSIILKQGAKDRYKMIEIHKNYEEILKSFRNN